MKKPNYGILICAYNEEKHPRYMLIEGERIGEASCPVPVYDLIRKYLERRQTS